MAKFSEFVAEGTRRHGRIYNNPSYQNLPNDKGNWTGGSIGLGNQAGTNMSISAPVLSAWRGYPVTAAQMQALTEAEALQIYKVKYWDAVKGDQIESQTIANFTADMKSSAGGNGVKQLQEALNDVGASVSVDGAVGNETVTAINKSNTAELNNAYREQMFNYYKSIGTGTNEQFLKHWLDSVDRDYPKMSVVADKAGLPESLNNFWWIIIAGAAGLIAIILLIVFLKK